MRPMLATLADAPLDDPNLVYEPKYDGIRALVAVEPGGGGGAGVAISSRLGNDKTAQFPEVVRALASWGARRRRAALLDGEIVALDDSGRPVGFQRLQDRIHLTLPRDIEALAAAHPVAFVAFDLLRDGDEPLVDRPLAERRSRLEAALGPDVSDAAGTLRISLQRSGDGTALLEQARREAWEGIIAKDARSKYQPGRRTRDWRKLKLVKRQEFVVGGWTDPRRSRAHFGALLLGIPEGGRLRYAGHTGGGFTDADLGRIAARLAPLATGACPFTTRPPTNERPHWVRPELVVEVKFSQWTDEGYLRHPIFLGLRDDVPPGAVTREKQTQTRRQPQPRPRPRPRPGTEPPPREPRSAPGGGDEPVAAPARLGQVIEALEGIEARGGGTLALPDATALDVGNLGKPLWPALGITKGELMRYYVTVAPYLLPVVRDRPLVMRRFPNGVDRPAFYQHRAPEPVPAGVRAEAVPGDDGEVPRRLVGGSLATLLYMAHLGAVSQDPWFSRVQSPADIDFCVLDLDPMPGAAFSRVRDVARWVRDELAALGVGSHPKTSGASGLHVYIPMRPGTPYRAGLLFCQIVATLVSRRHPRVATVERAVRRREDRAVYVDYLQNVQGKTLACAYSARASVYAGASTPVTWQEVDEGLDPRAFTIRTLPARLRRSGDLWAGLARAPGVDLEAALERARARHSPERGR
jgi:bifunctional non-homologous end joining protein LigD